MNTLRIGIIGTGSVVREIYRHFYFRSEYAPLMRVEAICDPQEAARNGFGEEWGIPQDRRFASYEAMIEAVPLDMVAVNTPDSLHARPTIAALEAGLDVLLPKPTADTVTDVHAMIETVERTGRFLGVDFHKRHDPVVKEARARIAAGAYGTLQSARMDMLDRLSVADPNHEPRFFSSPDFAEKNSPVSFLTSHMADTFICMTRLRPLEVRAVGYRQKLPRLAPIAVDGYDLVDTTVLFEQGVICHITTGWALPNPADCLTVQSARFIFSDGQLELWSNHYGYREITSHGIENRNVLFLNFEIDGSVSGYGVDSPGAIVRDIHRFHDGTLSPAALDEARSPFALGFYTTLVCESAMESLHTGRTEKEGVVVGATVDVRHLLHDRIGAAADRYYR